MILPLHSRQSESWEVIRARMLRETEAFLELGLLRPDLGVRIPAVPVGKMTFPRGYADAFWSNLLASS